MRAAHAGIQPWYYQLQQEAEARAAPAQAPARREIARADAPTLQAADVKERDDRADVLGATERRGGGAGHRGETASQVGSGSGSLSSMGTAWAASNEASGGGGGGGGGSTKRPSAFNMSFASALDIYSQPLRGVARGRPGALQQQQQQQSTESALPRKLSQSSSQSTAPLPLSVTASPTRQSTSTTTAAAALDAVRQPAPRSKPMTVLHSPLSRAVRGGSSERETGESSAHEVVRSSAMVDGALERVRQTHLNRQYGFAASSMLGIGSRPAGFTTTASDTVSKTSANDDRYSKMSDADMNRILGRMRTEYLNK